MPSKPVRSVLLGAQSEYRALLVNVARRFKQQDTTVHLYCATAQELDFYRRKHRACFDTVTVDRALYSGCQEPVADVAAEVNTARRNEQELGLTYNRLAMTDRHLGRGYALGGFKHPRSYLSRDTSYVGIIHGYNRAVAFWRDEIAGKSADAVVNCGKVAAVVARAGKVPYRVLATSRYRNLHYWAINEFFENPAVEAAFRSPRNETNVELARPYDTHLQSRRQLTKDYTLRGTSKATAINVAQRVYWRLRGYEKARGYFLTENLSYLWRRYSDRVRMTGAGTVRLADLRGQQFVFYPLHTEPETSLQTMSPDYFYQLSCIAALSRDLPAGAILAVKEHFAGMGRRPTDFHAQIREFKNVILINAEEFGLDCVRQARATATITATSGFEAAAMGKPVISFGRHNLYNFLPHVMMVEDERQLAGFLKRIFDGSIDLEKSCKDGRRFLQAVIDTSFDLDAYDVTNPDQINDQTGETAYRALLASIDASPIETSLPARGIGS